MTFYTQPATEDFTELLEEQKYAITMYHTFTETLTVNIKKQALKTKLYTTLQDFNESKETKQDIKNRFEETLRSTNGHGDSFAVFIAPTFVKIFNTPNRLGSMSKIGTHFNISNLLRVETFPQEGYVLIVNKDKWALYHGVKTQPVTKIHIEQDKTLTILAATNKETDLRQLQQKSYKDVMKATLPRYAQKLSDTIKPIINHTPTVIVADSTLTGELKKHLATPTVAFITKTVNPETSQHNVETLLRTQMETFNRETINTLMVRAEKLETEDLTVEDLTDITHAAVAGKIETLIMDINWDEKAEYVNNNVTFDTEKSITPFLIAQTMKHGGGIKIVNSEETQNWNFNGIMATKRFN